MSCGPRTIRLDDDLETKVKAYCRKNGVSLNRLVNMAVGKFISEKHVIEMLPLEANDVEREESSRSRREKE